MADKVVVKLQIGDVVKRGEIDASLEQAPISALILQIGEDKQSEVISLDSVDTLDKARLLQDLIYQGKTTKTVLIGNTVPVVLETFDGKSMLDMDSTHPGIQPPEDALRKWDLDYEMVRTLARAIQTFDGKPIGDTRRDKEDFVLKLPWSIILYLGRQWNMFMAELSAMMEPDVVGDIIRK